MGFLAGASTSSSTSCSSSSDGVSSSSCFLASFCPAMLLCAVARALAFLASAALKAALMPALTPAFMPLALAAAFIFFVFSSRACLSRCCASIFFSSASTFFFNFFNECEDSCSSSTSPSSSSSCSPMLSSLRACSALKAAVSLARFARSSASRRRASSVKLNLCTCLMTAFSPNWATSARRAASLSSSSSGLDSRCPASALCSATAFGAAPRMRPMSRGAMDGRAGLPSGSFLPSSGPPSTDGGGRPLSSHLHLPGHSGIQVVVTAHVERHHAGVTVGCSATQVRPGGTEMVTPVREWKSSDCESTATCDEFSRPVPLTSIGKARFGASMSAVALRSIADISDALTVISVPLTEPSAVLLSTIAMASVATLAAACCGSAAAGVGASAGMGVPCETAVRRPEVSTIDVASAGTEGAPTSGPPSSGGGGMASFEHLHMVTGHEPMRPDAHEDRHHASLTVGESDLHVVPGMIVKVLAEAAGCVSVMEKASVGLVAASDSLITSSSAAGSLVVASAVVGAPVSWATVSWRAAEAPSRSLSAAAFLAAVFFCGFCTRAETMGRRDASEGWCCS